MRTHSNRFMHFSILFEMWKYPERVLNSDFVVAELNVMEKKYFFHITIINIPCQHLSAANARTVSCQKSLTMENSVLE